MTFAWILFIFYLIATAYLAWLGHQRTRTFDSFAIGRGDMSPWVVGITLAASTASAATFIINPGFIYVHGLSGFMHLVIAVGCGFCLMLVLLSFKFRQIGADTHALTMPHWIGQRFGSRAFALYFALVNLFAVAFVVLIVGGLSIVMQQLLGVSNIVALIIILTFVTSYIFIGGTYAHAFTNTLQGSLMLLVSLLIILSGLKYVFATDPAFFEMLAAKDDNLTAWVNTGSDLYNDVFSIYISGFIVGAALVCQPHIITKALYVKSDRQVRQYLWIAVVALAVFFFLPIAGFYARLMLAPEQLVDAGTGLFRQDLVMTVYLKSAFPDWLFTTISIVLLAAGMSTLDGILVSLSTISANDLLLNIIDRKKLDLTTDERMRLAYRLSHVILVLIAIVAFVICLDPPKLLGIFGQAGVYGMAVAAVPPIFLGILFRKMRIGTAWIASAVGLIVHFVLFFGGETLLPNATLAFRNPGVTACIALLISIPPTALFLIVTRKAA